MGVVGAWPFIRKKGYEPTLARSEPTVEGPLRRIDVLDAISLQFEGRTPAMTTPRRI